MTINGQSNSNTLEFTGERYTPEIKGDIWAEHHHRYLVALEHVEGKVVLDAGCGEGYGSALLAQNARSVTAVDISPEAVNHASVKYKDISNLRYVQASVTQLPLVDKSVDVVISFEVIEHLYEQMQMLKEIARVLKDDGLLIISSPDLEEYSIKREYANEYHVKELSKDEFAKLINHHFSQQAWFAQRMMVQSSIWMLNNAHENGIEQERSLWIDQLKKTEQSTQALLPQGMYWLVLATQSVNTLTLAQNKLKPFRVLTDPDEQLIRSFYLSEKKRGLAETHLVAREKHIAYLEADLTKHNENKMVLHGLVDERDNAIGRQQKENLQQHAYIEIQNTEIARLNQVLEQKIVENKTQEIELTRREQLVVERDTALNNINKIVQLQNEFKNQLEQQIHQMLAQEEKSRGEIIKLQIACDVSNEKLKMSQIAYELELNKALESEKAQKVLKQQLLMVETNLNNTSQAFNEAQNQLRYRQSWKGIWNSIVTHIKLNNK